MASRSFESINWAESNIENVHLAYKTRSRSAMSRVGEEALIREYADPAPFLVGLVARRNETQKLGLMLLGVNFWNWIHAKREIVGRWCVSLRSHRGAFRG
jgi:hypothetical protein